MSTGTLYMMPMTLGGENPDLVIPSDVQEMLKNERYFIVENIKTTRRYLRKVDRSFPIDDSTFFVLNKKTGLAELHDFLHPALEGNNICLLSEAGCPGVADPGATIVAIAHEKGIRVAPLTGPSSILLTIMGSGFSGQEFTFHGYLPKDRKDRVRKVKDFENSVYRTGHTHLFMDTPFRNMHVLEDVLNELADSTQLCIASNLTLPGESIRTMSVKAWRENAYDLARKPVMFALGKLQ